MRAFFTLVHRRINIFILKKSVKTPAKNKTNSCENVIVNCKLTCQKRITHFDLEVLLCVVDLYCTFISSVDLTSVLVRFLFYVVAIKS